MSEQRAPKGFNKKATLVLLAVSLASLIVISYALPFFSSQGPLLPRISVSGVDIVVSYKNGTIETKADVNCTRTNVAIISVLDVMLDYFKINYRYFDTMKGCFIEGINDAYFGWTYKVDSVSPSNPVDTYPVGNNSLIEWHQA